MSTIPGQSWRMILFPFSFLYESVIRLRNTMYDQGVKKAMEFKMPVISVGNITVGGTGKTPHTEFLVELLKDQYKVAILSRGYMRKTRDFRIATSQSSAAEIGDEPMQMKLRFPDVTVAVNRKRVHAIRELMKLAPPIEIIILDDAYQHRSLRPGLSLLLIDYGRPLWDDRMLPAGNMREPASGLHRANIILVSKCPEDLKPIEMREYVNRINLSLGQHLYFTCMKMEKLVPVFGNGGIKVPDELREKIDKILVISGVVNPQSLVELARDICPDVKDMRFRDHHRYSEKDVLNIADQFESLDAAADRVLIITTEKDATKLKELNIPEHIRASMYAARIQVHFLNDGQNDFEKQIMNYVTSNKRSSILYKGEDQ